ncbi:MAG: 30S ribosome-binding factor RbfA [Acetobacteraceae bacterium]
MKRGQPSPRQLRVAEEIRHILAAMFVKASFRDPLLAAVHITVTEVRISADLRRATAYVARFGRNDIGELMPALARAAPSLQGEVGRALKLRHTPSLVFAADAALEAAGRIEAVLRSPAVARDLAPER